MIICNGRLVFAVKSIVHNIKEGLFIAVVKVSHLCTTNFMNYIPIFVQLLKELPR